MKKELKDIQLKKTARDLRKVAFDSLELLSVNFIVFYYLIYQASKVDGKAFSDLQKGLKYSYEALFNYHALNIAIVVGLGSFILAMIFRPESAEKKNNCGSCMFGFFRRLSRTLLSLSITLFMFKFVALTHGHLGEEKNWTDPALFFISICVYISLIFALSYNDEKTYTKNITNVKQALKIIVITIIAVIAVIASLVFLEVNYHFISQLWS
ncbi:hypothetical protein EGC79_20345 [Shewanella vesiculosa]|uniref:hypothetical protein n=1 Tax=Shewanella vesiculosa TaxID=518738 RepID=UPI000F4FA5DD|nr:hypothetical protein [Shewanella vesiculosa]RPA33625.1 hypothetical protein EGC79_20345 [Shewanella vesiculosa]UJL43896.1 hypothetical protein KDH10_001270 [Shewanella vesiculosa]